MSAPTYYDDKDAKTEGAAVTTVVTSPEGSDYGIESKERVHVDGRRLDAAAALAAKAGDFVIDPIESERVRRKIDWKLLPMMMALYAMQFVDKTTLGSSSILGIKQDCNLSTTEYNLLGTLFYVAYLVFEWPQNLLLQRYPVGKVMAANITIWGIVLACHAACNSFAGLAVCRFLLGMCEGSITAGFMIITTMFYTREESTRRSGWWFLMNGTAQIVSGLLSFAVLQAGLDRAFKPWRIFFLLTAGLTLVVAACYWIWFPDSPTSCKWLTEDEKIVAVERIKVNQTGVENKVWKKDQFYEALGDWKTWAFFLLAALDNVPNSLTNQNSLIIKSLGYTTWQTTLLGCVSGAIEIITIYGSTMALKKWSNQRGYIGAVWLLPNVLGAVLVIALPWSNKAGILVSLYITGVGTPGFTIALAWINTLCSGHTKKTTANAIFLIGYCLGNLLAPLMWLDKYKPRNRVPWTVILICYACCSVILLGVRMRLVYENKQRDREQAERGGEPDQFGYVDEILDDGTKIVHKVDKAFLDLTDKQNRDYRYPL